MKLIKSWKTTKKKGDIYREEEEKVKSERKLLKWGKGEGKNEVYETEKEEDKKEMWEKVNKIEKEEVWETWKEEKGQWMEREI